MRHSVIIDWGLPLVRCQTISLTSAGVLLFGPMKINSCAIWIEILHFPYNKKNSKILSGRWWPFSFGFSVLRRSSRWLTRSLSFVTVNEVFHLTYSDWYVIHIMEVAFTASKRVGWVVLNLFPFLINLLRFYWELWNLSLPMTAKLPL